MKEAIINYFNTEYNLLSNLFDRRPSWMNPIESIHNTLQRCLGVAQFAQTCPDALPYEEIEVLYEELREKVEKFYDRA